jgi:PAS domain S-box-containing protein
MAEGAIDLERMAREEFRKASGLAPGRDLRFLAEDLPPAFGDAALIRQALSNLLDNAIKLPDAPESGRSPGGERDMIALDTYGRPLRILILEDVPADVEIAERKLREKGVEFTSLIVETEDAYRDALEKYRPDIVLADYTLPSFDGLSALRILRAKSSALPFIFVTGTIGEEFAMEAARAGASDYVHKDRIARLVPALRRALRDAAERDLRKQAERELRDAHEKLRHLLDHSPAVLYTIKIDGGKLTPVVVSENIQRLLGYSVAESIRYEWWLENLHPDDRDRVLAVVDEGMKGKGYSSEYRIRDKGGAYRWIKDDNRVVLDADGLPWHSVGVWTDITDLMRAKDTLLKSEMYTRHLLDTLPQRIFLKDRNSVYLSCNLIYAHDLGIEPTEIVGKDDYAFHPRELADAYRADDKSVMDSGTPKDVEERYRIDGEELWIHTVKVPYLDEKRDVIGVLGIFEDITARVRGEEDRRKLEEQLRISQKMEAVGTLAGGIAHDFNNALTGIMGFGDLLRLRLDGDVKSAEDLDEIMRCAERAATLTRQLLTFARRQVIELSNLNVSTVVVDMMKLIGKLVGEHIEVRTSLGKNVPAINADRGQIEQVIMNLCLNARDAMQKGGTLSVETGDVYLEEEYVRQNPYMMAGRYALLAVSDSGIGMDEKTRERVFEPFFTTKGPDKGTGLGLAVVYGIVKQHGGYINLYSEPGKGTTFKVYFPAVETQPDVVPTIRREEIVRGGTETILLAEDEEAIRSLGERTMRELGYTVLVARNGEEAIEIFRRNKEIALAVLDVVMPRKGGKEAFEEMYKQNPRLKVIFMSGYSADAIHDSFVLIAGVPFLQKPFGPATLARKIREVLDTQ